jgi:hypothetical protein
MSQARAWGISTDVFSLRIDDETRRRGEGSTNHLEVFLQASGGDEHRRPLMLSFRFCVFSMELLSLGVFVCPPYVYHVHNEVDRDPTKQRYPNFKSRNYHEIYTDSTRIVSDLLIFVGSSRPTFLSRIHSLMFTRVNRMTSHRPKRQ